MKYERTSSSPRMAVEEIHEDVKRRGRRVVATTVLQPGDAIYATPPDVAVLYSQYARHVCARCLVAEVRPPAPPAVKAGKSPHPHSRTKPHIPLLHSGGVVGLSSSLTAPVGSGGSLLDSSSGSGGASANAAPAYSSYVCPNCDQFVLCAFCVEQLVTDMTALLAAEADSGITSRGDAAQRSGLAGASWPLLLLGHPLLRAHTISCAWYISLPESIRAPGNDTDFLRFCLDYGARVQLGDTTMVTALNRLDTNAAIQSKEAHHLCEVFARDRVVATFGPQRRIDSASAVGAATQAAAGQSSRLESVLSGDRSGGGGGASRAFGASPLPGGPSLPPSYPVTWTDLRDVLLRTRCNSLGFPFTPAETIGWSLQETICMLNHSCVPNAAVVMLYDTEDEQRAAAAPESGTAAESSSSGTPPARSYERGQLHQHYRRGQRMASSSSQDGSAVGSGGGTTTMVKNLSSFRAIAVSSPSPFTTSYSESLRGWIGIQAIRPIAAGEEITVSYIDLEVFGDDVQARSRHLLEQYRFLCTCELCTRQRGRKL